MHENGKMLVTKWSAEDERKENGQTKRDLNGGSIKMYPKFLLLYHVIRSVNSVNKKAASPTFKCSDELDRK